MIGSDEGIKLVYIYDKVFGFILVNLDGITLDIDFGTDMGSLNGSFYGSNDGKLENLLLGNSLGSTCGKVIGTVLVDVDGITLGVDVGT